MMIGKTFFNFAEKTYQESLLSTFQTIILLNLQYMKPNGLCTANNHFFLQNWFEKKDT